MKAWGLGAGWPDKFSPSPCCSAQVSSDLRLINTTESLQSLPFLTAGGPRHGGSLSLRNSLSRVLEPMTVPSAHSFTNSSLDTRVSCSSLLRIRAPRGFLPGSLLPALTCSPRALPHAPMAPAIVHPQVTCTWCEQLSTHLATLSA